MKTYRAEQIDDKLEWSTYVKKTIKIRAYLCEENGYIETLEGKLAFTAGNYICIGIKGEIYPYLKRDFEVKYFLVDESSSDIDNNISDITLITNKLVHISRSEILTSWKVFSVRSMPISAAKISEDFKVVTEFGVQNGKAGDYIIMQNPLLIYVCDSEIFSHTYEHFKNSWRILSNVI